MDNYKHGAASTNTFTDNGFKYGTDYNTEDGISTDANNGNGTIYGAYCGKNISTKTEDGISTDTNNGTDTNTENGGTDNGTNYYGNDSDYGTNISNDTSTGSEEASP